jgi:choice-of-anchor C domain-containing protein
MKKLFVLGIILVALLAGVGTVSAVTVNNPGFEFSGAVPAVPGYLTSPPGTLNDWTIGGTVDVIRNYWAPHTGDQSLDLAGTGPGTISQTIDVGTDQICSISFYMAGNPDQQGIKTIEVSFGSNAPLPFAFDSTGHTHSDMGWEVKTASGLPASGSTLLQFADTGSGPWGPALDDITVECTAQNIPVPEFPSMALPAAFIVGLIGAVLFIQSTKKN